MSQYRLVFLEDNELCDTRVPNNDVPVYHKGLLYIYLCSLGSNVQNYIYVHRWVAMSPGAAPMHQDEFK
jgi:hypothetical protein